jgi:hypothetical protein|nr:MAG TPA: hypothetical protein [Caudoviricetes sp.]
MIPRFRAWIKKQKAIVETSDIVSIDFEDEMVEIQISYASPDGEYTYYINKKKDGGYYLHGASKHYGRN